MIGPVVGRLQALCMLCVFLVSAGVAAGEGEKSADDGTVVLDTYSYYRAHATMRPLLFGTSTDAVPNLVGQGGARGTRGPSLPPDRPNTALPSASWTKPGFDDSEWWRSPAPYYGGVLTQGGDRGPHLSVHGFRQPVTLALLCLRGKFTVTDPGEIKALELTMRYRGGVVVYLNGKEVARQFMRKGTIDFLTLAEDYPLEATVLKKGMGYRYSEKKYKSQMEMRIREMKTLSLPVGLLEKGANVLAVEIHRAAMPAEALEIRRYLKYWNSVGLLGLRMVARGEGVGSHAERPKGFQVWNVNPCKTVFDADYGDPNEPLKPMRIVGARNGSFSGKIVVSSDKAIKGLHVTLSSLKHEENGGAIDPSSIVIRYPVATLSEIMARGSYKYMRWPRPLTPPLKRFDMLNDTAPEVISAREELRKTYKPRENYGHKLNETSPWVGAVQPVWVTIRVPSDAAPGNYEGTLSIRSAGETPVSVPVRLEVHGFRLPDPAKFTTWVDFIETPEAVAERYNVSLWSDAHWNLIGRTFECLSPMGDRTLYLPLICRTNTDNTYSMVRWIKNGTGYTHDFSLVEKYIDLALEKGLKPELVCFQVWDYHLGRAMSHEHHRHGLLGTGCYGQADVRGFQPAPVSLLDPSTGAITELTGPAYNAPEAKSFWKPVAERIAKIMKKRGLEHTAHLGLIADYTPQKEVMQLWAELLPDAPWTCMAHGGANVLHGFPIRYNTTVFRAKYAVDPDIKRNYGWQRKDLTAFFPRRYGLIRSFAPAFDRLFFEKALVADMRGAGRQGADNFPSAKRRGKKRYMESNWGSLTLTPPWLAAGEEGPTRSVRFEMGLEGIQECEARIFIEKALVGKKIGGALAKKCQDILDERTRCIILADEKTVNMWKHSSMTGGPLGFDWYAGGSNWQDRSAELYAAAAEVQKLWRTEAGK